MGKLVRGDLGYSIREMSQVSRLIAATWPNTLILTAVAMSLSLRVGLPLGIVSAAKSGSWLDHSSRLVSLLGLCMPVFWIGLVFMYLFSLNLGWFPTTGSGTLGHLVLPAVTLAAYSVASLARMTRSSLLEVLGEDYVRTARAKGLAYWNVVVRHALRNALIPIITVFGMQVGQLMGGAILTETVFAWPGVGKWLYEGVVKRDFMVIQGGTLLIATTFVLVNLIVDVLYAIINPRISVR